MAFQPAPGMNHAAWVLGHLACTGDLFGGLIGLDSVCPGEWQRMFDWNSTPVDDASRYPSKANLLATLDLDSRSDDQQSASPSTSPSGASRARCQRTLPESGAMEDRLVAGVIEVVVLDRERAVATGGLAPGLVRCLTRIVATIPPTSRAGSGPTATRPRRPPAVPRCDRGGDRGRRAARRHRSDRALRLRRGVGHVAPRGPGVILGAALDAIQPRGSHRLRLTDGLQVI